VDGKFTPGFGTVGVNFPANSEIKVDFDWGLSRSVGFLRKGILRIGMSVIAGVAGSANSLRERRKITSPFFLAEPAFNTFQNVKWGSYFSLNP
jgi:hypothetical protein